MCLVRLNWPSPAPAGPPAARWGTLSAATAERGRVACSEEQRKGLRPNAAHPHTCPPKRS